MQRRPAKALEPGDVRLLLRRVQGHRHSDRDRAIILLSFKAGLRACEIAGLDWPSVLATNKRIGDGIIVSRCIAKMGSGRQIPLHPDLKAALKQLHELEGRPLVGPIIRSERGEHMCAGSIVNWFSQLYRALNLVGCSSHSGRRTFITASARVLAKTGGSLRDIQELAGHRALATTQHYIEGSSAAQRRLISLI